MGVDIHNYARKLERQLALLAADKGVEPHNKDLIVQYQAECALQGIGKPRQCKNIEVLRVLANKLGKDFDKAAINDLKELVRQIDARDCAAWTKVTSKVVLKRFYKWLKGNNEEYPAEIKWLKVSRREADAKMLSQNELITDDEIQRAIKAARNPRDKAILSTLSESGCRISEIGNLLIKNISIDDNGAVLTVTGKTGSRRVRIIKSAPHLSAWLNSHPYRDNPNATVWVNLQMPHEHMTYEGFVRVVTKAFERAGIKKHCNLHLLRHSRATSMANYLTEFQMNHYFGWAQGSRMPSTYVHLSGKDLDGAILKMNGIKKSPEQEVTFRPRQCDCGTINTPDSTYCNKCGNNLTKPKEHPQNVIVVEQKQPNTAQEMLNLLAKEPAIQKFIAEKIIERGMSK
jgi:integrase